MPDITDLINRTKHKKTFIRTYDRPWTYMENTAKEEGESDEPSKDIEQQEVVEEKNQGITSFNKPLIIERSLESLDKN